MHFLFEISITGGDFLNPFIIFALYIPLFIIIFSSNNNNKNYIMTKIITNRKKQFLKEKYQMTEIAKKFLNKECIIYTFNTQITGTIIEVCDNAILIENKNSTELINCDFIVRIREYPKDKKGKRKSVVLD